MPPERTSSQRTLAAIVFTDVVGFSARMQRDELATLALLQQDFAEMRRLCAEHDGTVLKTTGDGLLLTFTSAVQAVACALAIQRQFAAAAKTRAAGELLQHRVGIHLGDILVQDQDVMGDGVNIASRLQAEAEPGGICISQTVYDVVKNKLEMQAVNLGPRELKNIVDAMPVYRLLLEAQSIDGSVAAAVPRGSAPKNQKKRLPVAIGAGVVIVLIGAAILAWMHFKSNATAAAVAPAASTTAAVSNLPTAPSRNFEDDELDKEFAKRKDSLQPIRTQYLEKYDFEGLVRALRGKTENAPARPGGALFLRAAEQLVTLKEWLGLNLRRYNRQHPLVVHDLSGDATHDTSLFLAPDRRVVFVDGANSQPLDLTELKPPMLGAIIVSTIRDIKGNPPRDVTAGAQAFARFYNLPAMTEAMNTGKNRREKEPRENFAKKNPASDSP